MMTVILNQQKLADVVHDADLRHLLACALEYEGDEPNKLAALREYLVHTGLADKISARPESVYDVHNEIPEGDDDE